MSDLTIKHEEKVNAKTIGWASIAYIGTQAMKRRKLSSGGCDTVLLMLVEYTSEFPPKYTLRPIGELFCITIKKNNE